MIANALHSGGGIASPAVLTIRTTTPGQSKGRLYLRVTERGKSGAED
jgi:hypothetical protein